MVEIGPPGLRLLRREQCHDSFPALLRESEIQHRQPLDAGSLAPDWLSLFPSPAMAVLGDRLVLPAEGRPGQPEAQVLWGFRNGEEQATDLWHCQRQQVAGSPFSSACPCRRVTSK